MVQAKPYWGFWVVVGGGIVAGAVSVVGEDVCDVGALDWERGASGLVIMALSGFSK